MLTGLYKINQIQKMIDQQYGAYCQWNLQYINNVKVYTIYVYSEDVNLLKKINGDLLIFKGRISLYNNTTKGYELHGVINVKE